jgi:hypothetical protein
MEQVQVIDSLMGEALNLRWTYFLLIFLIRHYFHCHRNRQANFFLALLLTNQQLLRIVQQHKTGAATTPIVAAAYPTVPSVTAVFAATNSPENSP